MGGGNSSRRRSSPGAGASVSISSTSGPSSSTWASAAPKAAGGLLLQLAPELGGVPPTPAREIMNLRHEPGATPVASNLTSPRVLTTPGSVGPLTRDWKVHQSECTSKSSTSVNEGIEGGGSRRRLTATASLAERRNDSAAPARLATPLATDSKRIRWTDPPAVGTSSQRRREGQPVVPGCRRLPPSPSCSLPVIALQ